MERRGRNWKIGVAFALGLSTTPGTSKAQNHAFTGGALHEEAAPAPHSYPAGLSTDNVIAKMIERNRERSAELRRYSATRTYEIRSAEGKLAAQVEVRVNFEAPDKKTFDKTSEQGSAVMRRLVFDRLLQTEGETAAGREHHDSAITTANYSFAPAGEEDIGPYHCLVFEATPKRKDKYLFEGRIWVDVEDFAIVKVSGHPAKKPSFWVSEAEFVRRYQKVDGFWLPYRDETSVEMKLYGRKIFTVEHRQYTINAAEPTQVASGGAENSR